MKFCSLSNSNSTGRKYSNKTERDSFITEKQLFQLNCCALGDKIVGRLEAINRLNQYFNRFQKLYPVISPFVNISIFRECAALGGLFQQVVNDMKVRSELSELYCW